MEKQELIFEDLGQMRYKAAWDYQEGLLAGNTAIKSVARAHEMETGSLVDPFSLATQHYLLFVEHDPVYTIGKSGNMANSLLSEESLNARRIDFFRSNRGGDITFHGPGQIVGYPILDLEKIYTDIGRYMRDIEEVIIRTLGAYGIKAGRSPGETGVWLDPDKKGMERKICAIGVRSSRWITMHGFALNVNTDLDYFNFIIPCGIPDKQVTSIEKELGNKVDMQQVRARLKENFLQVFEMEEALKVKSER